MKKKIKALIIATSVAAIAGIGAVSFAAWETAGSADLKASETTGTKVIAVGFEDGTEVVNKGLKLMPIDQPSLAEDKTETYFYKVPLTVVAGDTVDFTGYKITATVALPEEAETGDTLPTGLKIAMLTADPDTGDDFVEFTSNWKALEKDSTVELKTTGITAGDVGVVYIALDSTNGTYSANAGKDFVVTIKLVAPTP